MCREDAVLELAAPDSDIRFVQMWVCDLVMSRSFLWAIPKSMLFAGSVSVAVISSAALMEPFLMNQTLMFVYLS